MIRIRRIDNDRADRASCKRVARVGAICTGARRGCGDGTNLRCEMGPRVTTIGGLVETQPGFGIGRGIRFTGAGVKHSIGVRQRAYRVRRKATGDERPTCTVVGQSVVRTPHATAGCA